MEGPVLKILVAEDEELIRKGIVLAVDWAAMDCVVVGEASNGEEALQKAMELRPTVIITDIRMPKMDGIAMVEKLREQGNDAYVVFLTAYDTFEYARSALRLGAVDFLVKPFRDGELEAVVQTIRERIAAKRGETAVAAPPPVSAESKSRYVAGALAYIHDHCCDPDLTIGQVAESLGISEGHLSHSFKKETGQTVLAYLTRCRITRAMDLLRTRQYRVYEVSEMVGYRDITHFSSTFRKVTGVSPTEYQAMN